jgi:DNA-binding LytR/AlgR family response regulator
MAYRAVVVDDEKELRTYLKTLLAQTWPELEICAEAANGQEALERVEAQKPQVVFLDIRMPGLSGLEVARKINRACHIVFVTAYDRYAVEAFDREAVDYLVKPVSRERLAQTVERLKKQLGHPVAPAPLTQVVEQVLAAITPKTTTDFLHWIRVQVKESMRLIAVGDVDFFQAKDKYTLVITGEGEALIRKSIKELMTELDPNQFWQIHRSVIVNVSRIEQVSRSFTGRGILKLKGRQELLTVSRNFLHQFKQM